MGHESTRIQRRRFLQTAATWPGDAVSVVFVAIPGVIWATHAGLLSIDQPFHCAVLNHRHGRKTADGLVIQVTGECPAGEIRVLVNGAAGQKCMVSRFPPRCCCARKKRTSWAVWDGSYGRGEHQVRVVWENHSEPRYRFAIDDNRDFLRDITKQRDRSSVPMPVP